MLIRVEKDVLCGRCAGIRSVEGGGEVCDSRCRQGMTRRDEMKDLETEYRSKRQTNMR